MMTVDNRGEEATIRNWQPSSGLLCLCESSLLPPILLS